jgi:hypothetical protein
VYVPLWPPPELSMAVKPLVSSNLQYSTRPPSGWQVPPLQL